MPKRKTHLIHYQQSVALKYQVYSALFMTLPFEELKSLDAEALTFQEYCLTEINDGKSPDTIVNHFFKNVLHNQDFKFKMKILVLLLQFIERQVVLLDALEDAAFPITHDIKGMGSLHHYLSNISSMSKMSDAYSYLKKYRTRIVLTAHPTQFYPLQILEIIEDLAKATKKNELTKISKLLLQLGKTSFKNPIRPTPVDEAEVHIYYLERIFYPVIKKLQCELRDAFLPQIQKDGVIPPVLELGFWPGGDRDGNPSVTPETTLTVARKLKHSIINQYINEIAILKRRLTFTGMWPMLDKIKERLNDTLYHVMSDKKSSIKPYGDVKEFESDLLHLRDVLEKQHDGLFHQKIDNLLMAIQVFGFYFASIDLRQDSGVHTHVIQKILNHLSSRSDISNKDKDLYTRYKTMTPEDKERFLHQLLKTPVPVLNDKWLHEETIVFDVIGSLRAVKVIQESNGYQGLHRYVISNTQFTYHILEVIYLAKLAGLPSNPLPLDIIPLFETIADIKNAPLIMRNLYHSRLYRDHLIQHENMQYVMLGFSDGIKDGGYLMANWSILQCKLALNQLSKEENINIHFFDGRGGTPARGGGNIHKFYRALNPIIDQDQIQITIQGQTISSDFGTRFSASYNIEQLFTAGLMNPDSLQNGSSNTFTEQQVRLLDCLSSASYDAYQELKNHPLFVPYMQDITPIDFYGELNNASRPPRRKDGSSLQVKDLRAIPFIGAWSQIKQMAPVYFGIGTAIQMLIDQGYEEDLKNLYKDSLFFRTLLQNAMQSILKSNYSITKYLCKDVAFSKLWKILYNETELSIDMLKRISCQQELLENDPVTQCSISLREKLVIPLSIIQQYALIELKRCEKNIETLESKAFKKIILKSLAASTNASRNST